jgi:1-aminocyclopropane-1-carboxylate deaminase/D-cysteine desulfhydrase-like pyridoxal-dependent ACC family enzyme
LEKTGIELIVKREDLIHPLVSGNKWRKLKYNISEAKKGNYDKVLTFGGAFSNHIYSFAAAGKIFGFKSIGLIRGEESSPLNPTLTFAAKAGMEIRYLDRETYRRRNEIEFINELKLKFPDTFIIPEGGSNWLGVKGCEEIIQDIKSEFDVICTAVGSGGTIAGLISGLNGKKKVLGFSALKGDGILDHQVTNLIPGSKKFTDFWSINYNYHFGGYAKFDKELINFILDFEKQLGIPLEPVYTGKMFFGILDLASKGFFQRGTKILALHTGGLQGLNGLQGKIDKLIQQKP